MKTLSTLVILLLLQFAGIAQEIKGKTLTVLKGGITIIRFKSDIVNYRLSDQAKEDYNINVEEGTCIRLWSKTGVSEPKTANLIVTEGKRNHLFTVQYQEKGDFNSTFYDFRNLKNIKDINTEQSSGNAVAQNNTEEKVAPEEKEIITEKKSEKESKAVKKEREEKEKLLAKERQEREALENEIAAERAKREALEKEVANQQQEKNNKLAKEKKQNDEKERKKQLELKEAQAQERLALAEKKKQDDLDKKIAAERKLKEDAVTRLEKERTAKEDKARKLQEDLIAKQEKEKQLQEDRIAKQERDLALAKTQKEQNELNAKLLAEKKQRESLEKKLAEERAKRDANEKALAIETQKREQREAALAKEKEIREAREEKLAAERKKREDAERKIAEEKAKREEQERIAKEERERYVPPPAEISITKKFPLINFKELPKGQYMDGMYFSDTTEYYKASQAYLAQKEDPKFKNAGTEMDDVRIQLCNINFSGKAAYIRFKIENKTNTYFLLGATMLKILEAESGKKYQLNPYYVSSFPIIDANSSAYIVYVMKPEQNISPESFVMMSIRERQSDKKFELNFPGNFYTDALKAVER